MHHFQDLVPKENWKKHIVQSSLTTQEILGNFVVLDLVPPESLKEIYDSFMRYLIAWQHAACECQLKSLKLFKLRPKHHSTDHLAAQMKRTKLNARKVMSCFPDESFLGVLKKIGIKCHSLSVMRRVFQRYLLYLSLRWRDARML